MQRRGCIDCRFNCCDAACLVIQSMLVAVCYVGLHCLLCWSSMLIVCYDTDQASHPCCKAAAAPLLRSMTWANKTRAAAAARALHQCVHLCRFYRCAAASNFHHASMQWVPTAAASAPAAAGALHQCVHLCRFYSCAAACLMIQSRLVAV